MTNSNSQSKELRNESNELTPSNSLIKLNLELWFANSNVNCYKKKNCELIELSQMWFPQKGIVSKIKTLNERDSCIGFERRRKKYPSWKWGISPPTIKQLPLQFQLSACLCEVSYESCKVHFDQVELETQQVCECTPSFIHSNSNLDWKHSERISPLLRNNWVYL